MRGDGTPSLHHMGEPPAVPETCRIANPHVSKGRCIVPVHEYRQNSELRRTEHFLFQGARQENRGPRRRRAQALPECPLPEQFAVRADRRRKAPENPRHSRCPDGNFQQDRSEGRTRQTRERHAPESGLHLQVPRCVQLCKRCPRRRDLYEQDAYQCVGSRAHLRKNQRLQRRQFLYAGVHHRLHGPRCAGTDGGAEVQREKVLEMRKFGRCLGQD